MSFRALEGKRTERPKSGLAKRLLVGPGISLMFAAFLPACETSASPDKDIAVAADRSRLESDIAPDPEAFEALEKMALSQGPVSPETLEILKAVTFSEDIGAPEASNGFEIESSSSSSSDVADDETVTGSADDKPVANSSDAPNAGSKENAVPEDVEYKGVSKEMWAEIASQTTKNGDPNQCEARVSNIPTTSDVVLNPGDDINDALNNNDVVMLAEGTHKISEPIALAGKTLIGASGGNVTIEAAGVDVAVSLGDNSELANVKIMNAENNGVTFGNKNVAYRVSVGRTGYSPVSNTSGTGFFLNGVENNCVVSTEAYEGYNEDGAECEVCYNGGSADGYAASFGSVNNSFIDSHAFSNSDDGFDFWRGKTAYMYFSSAFKSGLLGGKSSGDGSGVKMGEGDALHHIFKSLAYDNLATGFDTNNNKITPRLVGTEAYGNGRMNYVGVTNEDDS